MNNDYFPPFNPSFQEKHKVFISYHHDLDSYYKNRFELLFGEHFINKSVKVGDIDTDVSSDYVKRLIRENYISDSSVLVVLIGLQTYTRKHIDWEIYAGLEKNAGLVGICLPTHPDYSKPNISLANTPERLYVNTTSGYSIIYDWNENQNTVKAWIENAFTNKSKKVSLISNSSIQMQHNKPI